MPRKYESLYAEYLDLDKLIPITFFSEHHNQKSGKKQKKKCIHLGYLTKDGIHNENTDGVQRVKCSKCGKRFGREVNALELLDYQYKIKMVLHELFFEGCIQTNMEKRWGIPQTSLSKFKKSFVEETFNQKPDLVIGEPKELPQGLVYGDETYMGSMGNSNTEIVFCNDNFEILATAGKDQHSLGTTIINAFSKIPQKNRDRMRVLVSDGEPTYETVAFISNRRVIHVQQYHARNLLGQITLNKYEKYGPHVLHYQIHTHWKIFTEKKKELGFHWEIKFIQGKLYAGSGRPTNVMKNSKHYQNWRQKKNEYYSKSFQKTGSAKLFINLETQKISFRAGSKKWMKYIFQTLLPIFSGKCITNNRVESKHSQIKRKGNLVKQPDPSYSDKLFLLNEYIVQHGHLPPTNLNGKPLYKYLVGESRKVHEKYLVWDNDKKKAQLMISNFL
jgi:hypothetical protein